MYPIDQVWKVSNTEFDLSGTTLQGTIGFTISNYQLIVKIFLFLQGLTNSIEASDPQINEGYYMSCLGHQITTINLVEDNMMGGFSVMFWFRPTSGPGETAQTLFSIRSSTSIEREFALFYNINDNLLHVQQLGEFAYSTDVGSVSTSMLTIANF